MVSNLYATEPQAGWRIGWPRCCPIPDAQRVLLPTRAPRRTKPRSSSRASTGSRAARPTIVALEGSFHGRTVATLAATGQPAKRAPFEPLVDWFRFVPPGDLGALEAAMTRGDVGAVLLEPVMGEGGVLPLADDYLRGVRAALRRPRASC